MDFLAAKIAAKIHKIECWFTHLTKELRKTKVKFISSFIYQQESDVLVLARENHLKYFIILHKFKTQSL